MGNNDIKVRDLADTSSISTDNQIMVLTDDANNTVKNITVEDLISNVISTDNNNSITAGTDKKLYTPDPSNKIGNLENLTTTNKSNLVAAINELDSDIGSEDTKIGDLANLNTTDKTSVVNAINSVLDSPVESDLLHALKGYVDEGKLLSNTELYNAVYGYAHSTFDLSKFTVVGTPTITDEGIASGLDSSNYIQCDCINTDGTIYIPVPNVPLDNEGNIVSGAYKVYKSSTWTDGRVSVNIDTNNEAIVSNVIYGTGASYDCTKDKMIIKIVKSGLNYNLSFKINDGEWIDRITSALTSSPTDNYIRFMDGYNANLKQYQVFNSDGVEVFSGNKTGIDTVKPDNYTNNGNATSLISADGSFNCVDKSSSDYLSHSIGDLGDFQNLTIEIEFVHKKTSSSPGSFYNLRNPSQNAGTCAPVMVNNTNTIGVYGGISGNNNWYTCVAGKTYKLVNVLTQSTNTWTIYENGVEKKSSSYNTNFGSTDFYKNLTLCIGNSTTGSNNYMCGIINLNSVKVYLDGDLIYQPCLKIPYTQSKTGSKVADVAYRDRVIDTYNQFGSALYYTIDEINQNASVPLGEIYGLMQTAPDGQWINAGSSNISVTTVTAVDTYTVDLSSILPADGYTYECVFRYNIVRRDNSSNDTGYKITSSSGKVWLWDHVEGDPQLSTNYMRKSGQFVAIIDTSRSLTLEINETALNTSSLDLIMYRRIAGNY